jgi:universal stress protein A
VPPTTPRRWLVAHDFSASADAAARAAAKDLAASREGGTLVILHAYDILPPPAAVDAAGVGASLVALERAVSQESVRRLETVAEALRKEIDALGGATVEVEVVVRQGPAAQVIVEEAKSLGAERIAVGTHGRTGLNHLLLGSIAERVVRNASVPVLVVKAAA